MSVATPRRARRYSAALRSEARHMASPEGGGWNAAEIARIFNRRGVEVTYQTVLRWTNDDHNVKQLRWQQLNRVKRHGGRVGSPTASPETRLARARSMRTLGLSWQQIAGLLRFDFGDELTADEVRRAVRFDDMPQSWMPRPSTGRGGRG